MKLSMLDRREMESGFRRVMRAEVEGLRFSTSNYPDEGPSYCKLEPAVSNGEPLWKHGEIDGVNRVQRLEKDRAELLRKLDELEEQLSGLCDVADKTRKEKVHLYTRMAPSSNPHTGSGSDTWFPGGSPMTDRGSLQSFAADKHIARPPYFHHRPDPFLYANGHHIPGFGDPFDLKGAPNQFSGQYASCQRSSGRYFDSNSHGIEPCISNASFHQPSCSCFHCWERHQEAPVPPAVFSNKKFLDALHNSQLNFHGAQSHPRLPRELNPEMGSSFHNRPRRVVLTGGGRYCRPIASGAPFFSCFNCSEVLQIPKKAVLMKKHRRKIQCGACSTLIDFAFINKKLVLTVNTEASQVPTEVDNGCSGTIKEQTSYCHGNMNQMNADFCSADYDNSGYGVQTVDKISSISPPPPGSPLQLHFNYSSNNIAVNHFGKANQRQNSMKDTSLATEIEVPFHEYSNTEVSQDSGDGNREDDQLKISKGRESFLTNIIRKSFKDYSGSNETNELCRSNVYVNGHLIPDPLVKKAETLAGPIHPGRYWYDFQAGFWGVMGGPCLGIIPPFIEEFNYTMPEDCACGNTGVYVNGRELHQKDLNLLSGRGLPTEKDRHYIVDISGRVMDEGTGEELHSLGKLAPTVEKVKHGFGMKARKAVPKQNCRTLVDPGAKI